MIATELRPHTWLDSEAVAMLTETVLRINGKFSLIGITRTLIGAQCRMSARNKTQLFLIRDLGLIKHRKKMLLSLQTNMRLSIHSSFGMLLKWLRTNSFKSLALKVRLIVIHDTGWNKT